MSSFACENIHQGKERITDLLCLMHRGIFMRTEELEAFCTEELGAFSIDLCYKTSR